MRAWVSDMAEVIRCSPELWRIWYTAPNYQRCEWGRLVGLFGLDGAVTQWALSETGVDFDSGDVVLSRCRAWSDADRIVSALERGVLPLEYWPSWVVRTSYVYVVAAVKQSRVSRRRGRN